MSHPKSGQGFADSGDARWRVPVLDQQGPDFDVRRVSCCLEPCGVVAVSVAVQKFLDGLCEIIFQFCRSASAASRAGGPVLTGGTR